MSSTTQRITASTMADIEKVGGSYNQTTSSLVLDLNQPSGTDSRVCYWRFGLSGNILSSQNITNIDFTYRLSAAGGLISASFQDANSDPNATSNQTTYDQLISSDTSFGIPNYAINTDHTDTLLAAAESDLQTSINASADWWFGIGSNVLADGNATFSTSTASNRNSILITFDLAATKLSFNSPTSASSLTQNDPTHN